MDPVRVVAASPWRPGRRVSRLKLLLSSSTAATKADLLFAGDPATSAGAPATAQPPLTQAATRLALLQSGEAEGRGGVKP